MTSPAATPVIGEVLNWAAECMSRADLYFGHGTDNAWDEACLLLFAVLDIAPDVDESIAAQPFPEPELHQFNKLLERRIQERLPMAYLLGKTWYGGYSFIVNEDVLVPRSPLAEMINRRFIPWYRGTPVRILDLCAGSGCLGILCAHRFPGAEVTLGELSPAAISVARQNVALHQLESRVEVVESDLFDCIPPGQFDIILSNPPYVDAEDMASLPVEFRREPRLGMVSGPDGLDITRRILFEAEQRLAPDGVLVVEVGNSWAALEEAYPDVPFTWVELEHGGQGIFVLSGQELGQFSESWRHAYNRGAQS